VRLITGQFAMLPFTMYRMNGRKREVITDHWLYRLLAKRPNRYQNSFEWREMLQGHVELRGNCFNQIIANGRGEITELLPIHPDHIKMELLEGGSYRWRVTDRNGKEQIFGRGDIWHIRGMSSDGYMGLSTIECARESVGLGLSMQSYASRFFSNDAKPSGGWIEFPGNFKDKASRDNFRESWQSQQGGANRGKVAVLEHGMKFNQLGMSNDDAQFLESRKEQISEIARWFGVPPHKIGDLARSTNNNIEQQALEFVQDCLAPRAERWEASIEFDLLLEDDIEVEFDFAGLLRGDSAARAAYYSSGINGGWLVRNEARVAEKLDPIDGLDEPLRPLNMVEESDAADELVEQDKTDDKAALPALAPDARLVAMAAATSSRLVRRAIGALKNKPAIEVFGGEFGSLVAESLAIDGVQAAQFCEWAVAYIADPGTASFEAAATDMLITFGATK
jgi:HK97 family phage portal protein